MQFHLIKCATKNRFFKKMLNVILKRIISPTIRKDIYRCKEIYECLRKSYLKIQPDDSELLRREVSYQSHEE